MSLSSPDNLGRGIEDGNEVGVIAGLCTLSACGRGGELAAGLGVESSCRESRSWCCLLFGDSDPSCYPLSQALLRRAQEALENAPAGRHCRFVVGFGRFDQSVGRRGISRYMICGRVVEMPKGGRLPAVVTNKRKKRPAYDETQKLGKGCGTNFVSADRVQTRESSRWSLAVLLRLKFWAVPRYECGAASIRTARGAAAVRSS